MLDDDGQYVGGACPTTTRNRKLQMITSNYQMLHNVCKSKVESDPSSVQHYATETRLTRYQDDALRVCPHRAKNFRQVE